MNDVNRAAGDATYVLGHSPTELQRLAAQGQFLGEPTLELLVRAGIGPGMRVLDLGSGAGDVSFMAASLVGSSGSVLGIDRAPAAVEAAGNRAQSAGVTNVEFREASIESLDVEGQFDAIVGRLVLMYLPDPTANVAALVGRCLKPGGTAAFLEFDLEAIRQVPHVALVASVKDWILETFRRAGHKTELGTQLPQLFRAAGLTDPQVIARVRMEAAPAFECTRHVAAVVNSILPMIERFGVARADEVKIESLAERMQGALVAANATLIMPTTVGAWARLPG